MIKREELTNPASCMSRAKDDEMTFVLLGRDAAAPVAIRAWVAERLRLGKNSHADPQIQEALECAAIRAWVAERLRLGKNSHADPQIQEALECAAKMQPAPPLTGPAMEAMVRACAEEVWQMYREPHNLTWNARKERTFEALMALVVETHKPLLEQLGDAHTEKRIQWESMDKAVRYEYARAEEAEARMCELRAALNPEVLGRLEPEVCGNCGKTHSRHGIYGACIGMEGCKWFPVTIANALAKLDTPKVDKSCPRCGLFVCSHYEHVPPKEYVSVYETLGSKIDQQEEQIALLVSRTLTAEAKLANAEARAEAAEAKVRELEAAAGAARAEACREALCMDHSVISTDDAMRAVALGRDDLFLIAAVRFSKLRLCRSANGEVG